MKLQAHTRQAILKLQQAYPETRSALIPALHLAQADHGYLPLEIQSEVADLFNLDPNEIKAIITFYDMFFEQPVGKHLIHVCKNISCMLRGSDEILQSLCHRLQINPGETSADGEFTILASECLAACDKAPLCLIDERIVGPLQEKDLEQLLVAAKNGPGHPSAMPTALSIVEEEVSRG